MRPAGRPTVKVFSGPSLAGLKARRALDGSTTPDGSFGFGPAGAYLAADPGNREAAGEKCVSVAEQACASGRAPTSTPPTGRSMSSMPVASS